MKTLNRITKKKIKSLTLTELLVVMVIIGILTFLALPKLMPLVTQAKSQEAKAGLKMIQQLQNQYKMENNRYAKSLEELRFEKEKTVQEDPENGTSVYEFSIIESSTSSFTAQAKAVVDFDEDGSINQWEISMNGKAKEIVQD